MQTQQDMNIRHLRKLIAIMKRHDMKLREYKKTRSTLKKHLISLILDDISTDKMKQIDFIQTQCPHLIPALKHTLATGQIDRNLL